MIYIPQQYFTEKEMRCPCCQRCEMEDDFMEMLYAMRSFTPDIPYIVSSGYRCEAHNTDVGSCYRNHPEGRAVDIICYSSKTREILIIAALKAGFKRIGIAKNMIHIDNMDETPGMWLY